MTRTARAWIVLVLVCASSPVAADDKANHPSTPDHAQVFRYQRAMEAHPWRAALEVLGLLGIGTAQYFLNHDANSGDWDFDYNWTDLRNKITGNGYAFDTNEFDTNYITHPASGTTFYWAARSNRLPVLTSFVYALSASTLWEIFGELRERASINDLLITPVAGLVLGETTVQLGAFFDRSCATPINRTLGTVLSAPKSFHDLVDGARLLRDTDCDERGLTRQGGHELRLSLAQGVIVPGQASDAPILWETQLDLTTRVIALNDYGEPGQHTDTFADGNSTELWLHGGLVGSEWSDFTLGASVVPAGFHLRNVTRDDVTGVLNGHELIFGLLVGTEYSVHRYAARRSEADRLFSIDAPGVSVLYRSHGGRLRVEVDLRTSLSFAGVDAFALPQYLGRDAVDTLPSVAQAHGYNHATGLTVAPRARLAFGIVEAGIEARATKVWGITALDRFVEQQSEVTIVESRQRANAWLTFAPLGPVLRFGVHGAALRRSGSIEGTRAERSELRLSLRTDAVF